MRYTPFLLMGALFVGVISGAAQDEFPVRHGLPVNNYGDTLEWSEFEEALLAVDSVNPLDRTLFESIRGYGDDGYCFGMCLLAGAVYVEDGHMGLCKPLGSYAVSDTTVPMGQDTLTPFWPVFRHAYHVLWARQFTQPMVRFIVEYVSKGEFNNPVTAFNNVESYLAGNEIPIVLISESLNVSGGTPHMGGMHAVLPYRLEKNGTTWKIHVYDPSRPYINQPQFYEQDSNVIEINSSSKTWSYYGPSGGIWDGFIYVVPGIRLLLPSTNPLLISNLSQSVALIIVNGGVLEDVSTTATNEKLKVIPYGFSGDSGPKFYIVIGMDDGTYRLKISGGAHRNVLIAMHGAVLDLTGESGDGAVDIVEIAGANSGDLALTISSSAVTEYTVKLHKPASHDLIDTYELTDVLLEEGEGLTVVMEGGVPGFTASKALNASIRFSHYENGRITESSPIGALIVPGSLLTLNFLDDQRSAVAIYKPWRFKLWAER